MVNNTLDFFPNFGSYGARRHSVPFDALVRHTEASSTRLGASVDQTDVCGLGPCKPVRQLPIGHFLGTVANGHFRCAC
jgi:hypothetical protein